MKRAFALIFLMAQGGVFGYVMSQAATPFDDLTGVLLIASNSALVVFYGATTDNRTGQDV